MEKKSKLLDILYSASPAILIWKLSSYIFKKTKGLFKKNKKPLYTNPEIQEVISTIKESKKVDDNQSFITGFKYNEEKKSENTRSNQSYSRKNKKIPMEFNQYNRDILKNSIIITLFDNDVDYRNDIEFIGNSRINGKPIYRYIGKDFKNFDLPYSEIPYFGDNIFQNDPNYYQESFFSS